MYYNFSYNSVTGYIPRIPFKFGGTYKNDCDVCIDENMTNYQNQEFKIRDLKNQVNTVPRLTAISHDPHVKDYLDRYRDTHPNRPMLMGKWLKIYMYVLMGFFHKAPIDKRVKILHPSQQY